MRNNRLVSLIVVAGAIVLLIALVSTTGTVATQGAPNDEALSLNRRDPRSGSASYVVAVSAMRPADALDNAALAVSSQGGQRSAGITLNQRTRDAIQARWLARYGGTSRTCVLLCGGW